MTHSNPYTPGAGFMPSYLAGREGLISHAEQSLLALQKRYPQQSMIYYGLRGVGKTVLLNTIENSAEGYGILFDHIEADSDGKFTQNLLVSLQRIAHEVSFQTTAKDFARRFLALLKAFRIQYKLEEGEVSFGVDPEAGFVSGVYSNDLTDLMTQLGKAAQSSGDTICLFIDEMQYLRREEIAGLIVALHRCNQLRLPIMAFCAGLPKVLQEVGEACSYAERLFQYEVVGPLKPEEAAAAITVPAEDFEVAYDSAAVEHIIAQTGGYPYFIQQMCSSVWQVTPDKPTITLEDVQEAEPKFWELLDKGFFAVRYRRCTPREKAFIAAMVKCGKLPCTIANVAKLMNKSVSSISPIRAQLISKGMIYPTSHGEIDFTVPQFDAYVRRINPNLEME